MYSRPDVQYALMPYDVGCSLLGAGSELAIKGALESRVKKHIAYCMQLCKARLKINARLLQNYFSGFSYIKLDAAIYW